MLQGAALEAAEPLSRQRDDFEETLHRAAEFDRWVLIMGDSTLLDPRHPPWTSQIAGQLRLDGVQSVVATAPARDFFHHSCLLPAHLDLEPEAVLLVANVRMFWRGRRDGRAIDLCSYLPPRSWIRAPTLPWHDRGVTLLRLALARLLTVQWIEHSFRASEGLRSLFAAQIGAPAAARNETEVDPVAEFLNGVAEINRQYTARVTVNHPVIEMMRATVREATRRGARVIVVVGPVPLDQLRGIASARGVRFEKRSAMLGRVVESAGGDLVDLHALLTDSAFKDVGGHYKLSDTWTWPTQLLPRVYRALGLPPPKPLHAPTDPPGRRQP